MKVVIIGGVAGGASAAARLRRLEEKAEIVMLEKGEYISFANCGLPYYIGGEIKAEVGADAADAQELQRALQRGRAHAQRGGGKIDPGQQDRVTSSITRPARPTRKAYDKLILSPGAEPFVPPIEGAKSDKVFTLRNIPDTYRIKDYVDQKKPRTAIVAGGGFIGVEMAENLTHAGVSGDAGGDAGPGDRADRLRHGPGRAPPHGGKGRQTSAWASRFSASARRAKAWW